MGNSLEVIEAINTLHGHGPADFREHCLHVSAHMLVLGKCAADLAAGRRMAERVIASGAAFEKFRVMVRAQGGDVSYVDDPEKFPKAKYVEMIDAGRAVACPGKCPHDRGSMRWDWGRAERLKGDPVDHAVGVIIHHKVGNRVKRVNRCSPSMPAILEDFRQPVKLCELPLGGAISR